MSSRTSGRWVDGDTYRSGYEQAMADATGQRTDCVAMGDATLDLVLERQAEEIHEPEFVAYAPIVSFEAFLAEQRIFGWVRLDADRLTDLLNEHEILRLVNVLVEDWHSGAITTVDEALIQRSEIIAVIASGPRGNPSRRRSTEAHRVLIESKEHRIGGCIHVAPGCDPVVRWHDGGPMIPLTDAWVEYRSGGECRHRPTDGLIVNRGLVTQIEVGTEAAA